MVTFEIRNKDENEMLLGYLFYYERSRRFFAEILDGMDEWTAPYIFAGHIKRGVRSIDSIWAGKFVCQRIVPPDRQNLGSILKHNGLKDYDEYKLLLLSEGRCAQDELYVVRIPEDDILPEIRKRLDEKVLEVMPLQDQKAIVFFRDGKSVIADIVKICGENRLFGKILRDKDCFKSVHLSPGGYGIEWDEERFIAAEKLRSDGTDTCIAYEDVISFVKGRLADTAETVKILNCSRQYINQLADKDRLTPVREGANTNIYLKSELEAERPAYLVRN